VYALGSAALLPNPTLSMLQHRFNVCDKNSVRLYSWARRGQGMTGDSHLLVTILDLEQVVSQHDEEARDGQQLEKLN